MKLKEQRAERGAKHQADASEKKAKKEAVRTRKAWSATPRNPPHLPSWAIARPHKA
jgi:hypothetical protein